MVHGFTAAHQIWIFCESDWFPFRILLRRASSSTTDHPAWLTSDSSALRWPLLTKQATNIRSNPYVSRSAFSDLPEQDPTRSGRQNRFHGEMGSGGSTELPSRNPPVLNDDFCSILRLPSRSSPSPPEGEPEEVLPEIAATSSNHVYAGTSSPTEETKQFPYQLEKLLSSSERGNSLTPLASEYRPRFTMKRRARKEEEAASRCRHKAGAGGNLPETDAAEKEARVKREERREPRVDSRVEYLFPPLSSL